MCMVFIYVQLWFKSVSGKICCIVSLDGLPSFSSFGQAVSEEKIFKNRPIRNNIRKLLYKWLLNNIDNVTYKHNVEYMYV